MKLHEDTLLVESYAQVHVCTTICKHSSVNHFFIVRLSSFVEGSPGTC